MHVWDILCINVRVEYCGTEDGLRSDYIGVKCDHVPGTHRVDTRTSVSGVSVSAPLTSVTHS